MAPEAVSEVLRVLDAGLPLIAAKAAVELDRFAADSTEELPSVGILAKLIENSVDAAQGSSPKSLMDPSTITVMSYAIENSEWSSSSPPTTVSELAKIALKIGKSLSNADSNSDISKLREFCVALSRCSANYRLSIFGTKAPHPFRRLLV